MATYSGIDKVGEFFAHYGRKGMKRGRNIFNPNYKPVGEIAKGPQAPGAKFSNAPVQAKKISGSSDIAKGGLNTGSLAPRSRREALNRWDAEATSEERESAKKAAKIIKNKASRRLDKVKEAEKRASDLDEKTLEKAGKYMGLITKGLGLKSTGDYVTDYAELAMASEENEEIAKAIKDMKTLLDTVSKNLSMEEATEARSIMATEQKKKEIEIRSRNEAASNREKLLEAERKRQAAIDRR